MAWSGRDNLSLGTNGEGGEGARSSRADTIAGVVLEVIERRSRGESLPDEAVVAAHRDLLPELEAELAALKRVHHARLAAMKAGLIIEPSGESSEARGTEDFSSSSLGGESELKRGESANQTGQQTAIRGYSIVGEINSGGQGTVFKAVQEATGRVVAIKVIPGGLLISSRHRARFEREVGILALLDHPSIVGVLDRGRTADGSLFMVMDYIDGGALDEYVERCRAEEPGNLKRLVELFVAIARAVDEAHARGVVHRDLKPSNIRIDKRGEPYILDFGLARLTTGGSNDGLGTRSVTMSGQIVGSLPWASPEQVSGHSDDLDVRSDVYSLGVMLYQALTGSFPYSVGGVMPEVVGHILRTIPEPPSHVKRSRGGKIGAALDAIVLKALAKSPGERYATAGELSAALEDYLAGRPVAGARWRCPRWVRIALVGVLGGSAIGGVGAVAWWQYQKQAAMVYAAALPSYVNDVGMRFVRIPRGGCAMGNPDSVEETAGSRLRLVPIDYAYYIGVTEVTQEQYRAVMGALPCEQRWNGTGLPVQGVRWEEAMEFCRRLSQKEGVMYRLPTEKEWECACRAGFSTLYAGTRKLETMGWYQGNSGGQVHQVGGKSFNHWGLYDMHGNVAEWCLDIYTLVLGGAEYLSAEEAATIPEHVLRGGGATGSAKECGSGYRRKGSDLKPRVLDVGFRVVLEDKGLSKQ